MWEKPAEPDKVHIRTHNNLLMEMYYTICIPRIFLLYCYVQIHLFIHSFIHPFVYKRFVSIRLLVDLELLKKRAAHNH